ncbi:MAG: bifunctional phosphopantothenoylcysteine decarboxylase/phosphopantothenate--cysteine ligase CoaBC [Candidatus Methanomethylophilaceae archaeon]|nr:bifunctional phosphopantothenoylcysteine decarboxylase/phosphopantothenate--cysteine ligase CoaBC [Candidatus Methanomethylophilaceae archaeon]
MHPSEEIYCERSGKLRGKRIVMGITGSIAAVECFSVIRELIRHGAEVVPVLTEAASRLVAVDALEFASGRRPVTELTGRTEHVTLMSEADLLLIFPATANTVSKIASGIDDTTVTSMATVAIGSGVPVAIAPAMHESLYRNPAVRSNVEALRSWGIEFIGPRTDGVRAKVASKEEVVERVIRMLSGGPLAGRRVLVIGGRSSEAIDSMRLITNRSSGRMAASLASRAFEMGADVELWMGGCDVPLPGHIATSRFSSVSELRGMAAGIRHDVVLVPAALADFAPASKAEGKISSDSGLDLRLKPVPKLLPEISRRCPFVVGFKAESGLGTDDLVSRARSRLESYGLSAVVANDISAAGKDSSSVLFVTKGSAERIEGSKDDIADAVLSRIAGML